MRFFHPRIVAEDLPLVFMMVQSFQCQTLEHAADNRRLIEEKKARDADGR
jgi:hypothetical protein